MGRSETGGPTADTVLADLRRLGSEKNRAGMARFGIDASHAFGVPLATLRPLAKTLGGSHELARELWDSGFHEARLLAILVTPPESLSPDLALTWLQDVHSWDLCDQLCNALSRRADTDALVTRLATDEREFVRRAGFSLIAWRAVHAKKAPDSEFSGYFDLIRMAANDEQNYVWKAVHWALRQIGKRSAALHGPALALSEELKASDNRTARKVGSEAVRELLSEKVRTRLGLDADI